jgi:hypothetical protein
MMILSYLVGQKYFPVKYNLIKFSGYLGLSVLLYLISTIIKPESSLLRILFHTVLLLLFAGIVSLVEKFRLNKWMEKITS